MSIFSRNSMQGRGVSAALTSDLGPGMHPRISTRGGQFALIDGGGQRHGAPVILQNTPQGQKLIMLAIIVGSNPKKSRIYYENPFDPDNPAPPDCFSDNGLAPSVNASSPQARTCAECNWSKWGSDVSQLTGKKTKACDEKKKLAVIVINDTAGHVYELQIPPATLKNIAKYASQVQTYSPPGEQRKADVSDFITAISFLPGQTGVLEFAPFGWISSTFVDNANALRIAVDQQGHPILAEDKGESTAERIDTIWNSQSLDEILGLTDTPWQPPALAAPLPGMQAHSGALQPPARTSTGPAGSLGPYAPAAGAAPAQPAFLASAAPYSPQEAAQPAPTAADAPSKRKPRAAGPARLPSNVEPFRPSGQVATATAGHDDIPDFLRQSPTPRTAVPAGTNVPVAPGPAPDQPANGGAAHGMVDAGAPPSGIEGALTAAFGLSTTRT